MPTRSPACERKPWNGIVEQALGSGFKLLYHGFVYAAKEAGWQKWHADGMEKALVVFVPLINVQGSACGTEIVPGTHKSQEKARSWWRHHCVDNNLPSGEDMTIAPDLEAGSALIIDWRILHRGRANNSGCDRPVLYFVYGQHHVEKKDGNFTDRSVFAKAPSIP